MYRGWETDPDGLVIVEREDGSKFVPTLQGEQAADFDAGCDRWGGLAERAATRWGLRPVWLLAMWWQESRFNPRAIRREPNGWTGVGLGQPTHPSVKGNLTDAQLMDPEVNAEVTARHVATLVKRYGDDFPRVSAAYNAGSARHDTRTPPNEYDLYCYGNHVQAETCAANRAILRRRAEEAQLRGEVLASQFDLVPLARDDAEEARREMATRPDA